MSRPVETANAEASARCAMATFLEQVASRPVRGRYLVAVEGATTERGGVVRQASGLSTSRGGRMALVGDAVHYPDGTEARIVSGSGAKFLCKGRSVALVGSELDNGDRIVTTAPRGLSLVEYADVEPAEGLLVRGYRPGIAPR